MDETVQTDETVERRDRLAELVAHLTDCDARDAQDALAWDDGRPDTAEEALALAARAMTGLSATARHLRVAPYLERHDLGRHDLDRHDLDRSAGRSRRFSRSVRHAPTDRAVVG